MSRSAAPIAIVGCCLAMADGAHLAEAQSLLRVGSEFQVNAYTTGYQRAASVGMDADGDFVVAWASPLTDGGDVFARRFNSSGVALATELQVNSYTTDKQDTPSVAVDASGDFVVAWGSLGQDLSGSGIFARRFDAAGTPLGTEFPVHSNILFDQVSPAAAMDADGDFVIAWASNFTDGSGYGVFARRFTSAGTALGAEFQVNTYTTGTQARPAIARSDQGSFVVVWNSAGQDAGGTNAGIFARRFNSAAVAQATEFQVNAYTADTQYSPAVAVDADGDFVVAWSSYLQDGQGFGVFARRFNLAGEPQSGDVRVNDFTDDGQSYPAVSIDADGDFVVTWASNNQDGSGYGQFARRFDAGGQRSGQEFQVNTRTALDQYQGVIGMDADGDFVIAWEAKDGSGVGLFAQRFAPIAPFDIDGNGTVSPLTDGILVLRYEFGFRGATLITGVVDLAGCTRCTAPAIEEYLAGQV